MTKWEKAAQVSEDVPQRCSCPTCLSLGCMRWNAGEWNCFTDQKLSHKKQNGQIWFVGTREGVNGARQTSSFSPADAFHGSFSQLLCSGMQSPNCAMCAHSFEVPTSRGRVKKDPARVLGLIQFSLLCVLARKEKRQSKCRGKRNSCSIQGLGKIDAKLGLISMYRSNLQSFICFFPSAFVLNLFCTAK